MTKPSILLTIAIYLICQDWVCCININDQFYGSRRACGSFDEVSQISLLDDRIRHNPSPLDENGGVAALHNSVTNFGSRTHRCGATLISNWYLLTAAHCFDKERLIGISIGRENLDEDTSPGINTYEIEKVIIHPDWKSSNHKYNDIALIRTNRVVQYSKKVWPYCLPGSYQEIHDYMSVQIAGWGYVNKTHNSPTLQTAHIKIVENSRCDADWYNIAPHRTYDSLTKISYPNGLTEQLLCAGRKGVDACNGDSGGPMTYQNKSGLYTVIGLVARGISNCPDVPVLPGFYTSIVYYLDWIYSTIGLPRPMTTTISEQHMPQPLKEQFARFTTSGGALGGAQQGFQQGPFNPDPAFQQGFRQVRPLPQDSFNPDPGFQQVFRQVPPHQQGPFNLDPVNIPGGALGGVQQGFQQGPFNPDPAFQQGFRQVRPLPQGSFNPDPGFQQVFRQVPPHQQGPFNLDPVNIPGKCPSEHNFCPAGPPRTRQCFSDGECAGFDKCCYNPCRKYNTCWLASSLLGK